MIEPMMIAVLARPHPSLSLIAEKTTSMMEIREVTPAKNKVRKNSTPKTSPNGMLLMIVGKATNARPMPLVATSSTPTPAACAM